MSVTSAKKLLMSGGLDPDARALVARMQVVPSAARQRLISRVIRKLRAAGVWSRLDSFIMLAAHSQQAALLDWKRNASASLVSGATIIPDVGSRVAVGGAYLDTNYNPLTAGSKYAAADASFGYWGGTYQSDAPSIAVLGGSGDDTARALLAHADGRGGINGNAVIGSGNATGPERFVSASLAAGQIIVSSNGLVSTAAATTAYVPNQTFKISAYHNPGLTTGQGQFPRRMFMAGASLTATQIAETYAAVGDYLKSIGAIT